MLGDRHPAGQQVNDLATALWWIGWLLLAAGVLQLWPMWYGLLRPRTLHGVTPLPPNAQNVPMVSIIVPARDEAAAIEGALRSMLTLDYPNLEIIAIDDRSIDGTGEIMDRLAAEDPRCRVIHLDTLPTGWLGKNHANWLGARAASGEYLLFTDGDVVFAPQTLRHAIAAMQTGRLDHLAVFPDTMMHSFGEALLMNYFTFQLVLMTQIWLVRFRWARRAFVGIGAFNLIARRAYEAVGTHERLRMEVADDLMLGKLIKESGFRQDALSGVCMLRLKWHSGMAGLIRGLEKNAFCGARFSLRLVALAVIAHLLFTFAPIVLAITGPARLPFAIFFLLLLTTHVTTAAHMRHNLLAAALFPVASLVFCYLLVRSTWITLRQGGVNWRGTLYPLAELRAGMIEWQPLPGFGGNRRERRATVRGDQIGGPAAR
jgi:glycosyltransferase involved in cell wall biosynthesis